MWYVMKDYPYTPFVKTQNWRFHLFSTSNFLMCPSCDYAQTDLQRSLLYCGSLTFGAKQAVLSVCPSVCQSRKHFITRSPKYKVFTSLSLIGKPAFWCGGKSKIYLLPDFLLHVLRPTGVSGKTGNTCGPSHTSMCTSMYMWWMYLPITQEWRLCRKPPAPMGSTESRKCTSCIVQAKRMLVQTHSHDHVTPFPLLQMENSSIWACVTLLCNFQVRRCNWYQYTALFMDTMST